MGWGGRMGEGEWGKGRTAVHDVLLKNITVEQHFFASPILSPPFSLPFAHLSDEKLQKADKLIAKT
jgi:hypothetical protein